MANDLEFLIGSEPAGQSPAMSGDLKANWAQKLSHRYTDAYRTAGFVVGLGTAIKILGFVIGGIGLISGIAIESQDHGFGPIESRLGVMVIVLSLLTAVWFFIVGVIASSLGQTQKATLDSAVNNSPFLNNDERAEIMHLN